MSLAVIPGLATVPATAHTLPGFARPCLAAHVSPSLHLAYNAPWAAICRFCGLLARCVAQDGTQQVPFSRAYVPGILAGQGQGHIQGQAATCPGPRPFEYLGECSRAGKGQIKVIIVANEIVQVLSYKMLIILAGLRILPTPAGEGVAIHIVQIDLEGVSHLSPPTIAPGWHQGENRRGLRPVGRLRRPGGLAAAPDGPQAPVSESLGILGISCLGVSLGFPSLACDGL